MAGIVEAVGKDVTLLQPGDEVFGARRGAFAELVAGGKGTKWKPRAPRKPDFMKSPAATMIQVKGGRVWMDGSKWSQIRRAIETHSAGLIIDRGDAPTPSLPNEEFATKDSELLACDVECRLAGVEGFYLELDIPGLDDLIGGAPR